MATVTLVIEHGMLAAPGDACKDALVRRHYLRDGSKGMVLVHWYEAGDVDTFAWPMTDYWTVEEYRRKLEGSLYDAREMGFFPSDVNEAVLPDGSKIDF